MPALQAYWKGQLQLSLVSFPVALYSAIGSSGRIELNQLHAVRGCYRRIRNVRSCPEHGPVSSGEIARGYEYEKDRYVIIDDADLNRIKLPTERTLEILQFVQPDELDPIYFDRPYYMAPEGRAGQRAYAVVHEAMRQSRKAAIGRVVILGRERLLAITVQSPGFRVMTLRNAAQIRKPEDVFADLRPAEVDRAQLELARQLVDQYTEPFKPERFHDRYRAALQEIINAKIAGQEPIAAQEPGGPPVINLMKALQQSLKEVEKEKKPPARSIKRPQAKRKRGKGA